METITIAGHPFNVPSRYSEGHELSANEASALNQVLHENLRNNFAKRVKDAEANGGVDPTALQAELDKYAESYEFGVRTGGGGGLRDPVETQAMDIARGKIKEKIKAKGANVSDYSAKEVTEYARKLLDKDPSIRELARKQVEESKAIAAADLDDLLAD